MPLLRGQNIHPYLFSIIDYIVYRSRQPAVNHTIAQNLKATHYMQQYRFDCFDPFARLR